MKGLINEAKTRKSTDNLTAIIIAFKNLRKNDENLKVSSNKMKDIRNNDGIFDGRSAANAITATIRNTRCSSYDGSSTKATCLISSMASSNISTIPSSTSSIK